MKSETLYNLVDVRTGKAAELSLSPMSGKACFDFVPARRATRFKRHEAQAAACLLGRVFPETTGYLSIEEACKCVIF